MAAVRYFAAAAEAAGRESEALDAGTVGELRAAMVSRHGPALERVLRDDADVVDVLPPFAGG
jgi:molybdopterin converting factor small subunit